MKKLKIEIDNQKISIYFKKLLSKDYTLKYEFSREEISNISFFNRMISGIIETHISTITIFSIKKENEAEQHFIVSPQYAKEIFKELKNYKYNIANEKEIERIIDEGKNIKNNEKFYFKMTIAMIVFIILLGIFIPFLITNFK